MAGQFKRGASGQLETPGTKDAYRSGDCDAIKTMGQMVLAWKRGQLLLYLLFFLPRGVLGKEIRDARGSQRLRHFSFCFFLPLLFSCFFLLFFAADVLRWELRDCRGPRQLG